MFAFSYLKIIEERKKDIAICFAQNIIEIRKKIDDIGSTSKVENTLSSLKNIFHKDNFIQAVCSTAFNSITTAGFKAELKSNF